MMNIQAHNQKRLQTIKSFCNDYLEHKISLYDLQHSIESINNSFENDMNQMIVNEIFLFVEELDYINVTYEVSEQYNAVENEIIKLDRTINQILSDKKE